MAFRARNADRRASPAFAEPRSLGLSDLRARLRRHGLFHAFEESRLLGLLGVGLRLLGRNPLNAWRSHENGWQTREKIMKPMRI